MQKVLCKLFPELSFMYLIFMKHRKEQECQAHQEVQVNFGTHISHQHFCTPGTQKKHAERMSMAIRLHSLHKRAGGWEQGTNWIILHQNKEYPEWRENIAPRWRHQNAIDKRNKWGRGNSPQQTRNTFSRPTYLTCRTAWEEACWMLKRTSRNGCVSKECKHQKQGQNKPVSESNSQTKHEYYELLSGFHSINNFEGIVQGRMLLLWLLDTLHTTIYTQQIKRRRFKLVLPETEESGKGVTEELLVTWSSIWNTR